MPQPGNLDGISMNIQTGNLDGISMNIQEENSAHYFRVQSEREQTFLGWIAVNY